MYEVNEYAHDLNDAQLKGAIVQATGLGQNSTTARSILGSFKALKQFANFGAIGESATGSGEPSEEATEKVETSRKDGRRVNDLKLGYTINLNLPATSDIAVFNAIFKALRDHLLDE